MRMARISEKLLNSGLKMGAHVSATMMTSIGHHGSRRYASLWPTTPYATIFANISIVIEAKKSISLT